MIYFTSDTHFGHANVIRFVGRPWRTIEQMDAALVASINARVGMRDELWILGDFSYRLGRDEALAIRQSITCRRVHFVPGNHDRNWAVPELEGAFLLEPPIAKIKYEGHRFVCSHYPIMDWEHAPRQHPAPRAHPLQAGVQRAQPRSQALPLRRGRGRQRLPPSLHRGGHGLL